jgi:hypothetical protein
MIHQLEIGMIMATEASPSLPGGHNSAVFIAWIEENISLRPEQRYPSGSADALPARPAG